MLMQNRLQAVSGMGQDPYSHNLLRNVFNLLMIPSLSSVNGRNSSTELTTADAFRSHAAPAGGAPLGGRGCDFLSPISLSLSAALLVLLPVSAFAAPIDLPSNRTAELQEVLAEEGVNGAVLRYRFVVPDLAASSDDLAASTGDLEYLCSEFALADITARGETPTQVVISMGSEPSDFGVINPDVLQVFELFSISDGLCIWEAF